MIELSINKDIKQIFPSVKVGVLIGKVSNSEHQSELWKTIDEQCQILKEKHDFESLRHIPGINSGKKAYKMLGKDPNRYRISAEAMLRRIVKGNTLYQINTVVDVLNLVSISSGVTIGGFDLKYVNGPVTLGIGLDEEDFEAIGRGKLNIHRLPVYRDMTSAIGSPTSDCTRTMLRLETAEFLMIITDFFNESFIQATIEGLKNNLSKYANGRDYEEYIS
jgi:DNA/RNA-binding domain of Phe-tRNA-synthetase-like protein